ncbi:hypothetical protein IV41_GL000709 [Limosilactobacillus ingluviei]|uniref:Uncharacterized protein n=1 Tax=Limosilactobacillus ingluviei TaxID=148604 RepID=A0A0R2H4S5_9LACO|nr:hypothetical protein IV41_GL000709 [Limosilactobacillus ingluviei]
MLDALALKATVDHDLAYYDREVTQDYLHAVEFTPLAQIDAPGLIAALQTLRQRQVKDLSLLLSAFDIAFDANRFWQALNVSATGIKYQVRSAQAAAALPTLCQLPITPETD